MARILGPVPVNRWERELLTQLKLQLPNDWVVISNVIWAQKREDGFVSDGQSDFVVLVPGSGMAIVEVKGSREIWIDDDGKWYRSDPEGDRVLVSPSPPEQAMGNMHQLVSIIKQRGGWAKFPGRYTWLVAYPNGVANQVPVLFDASTLITSRHMRGLAACIRNSLALRGFEARAGLFSQEVVATVGDILTSRPFAVTKADSSLDVQVALQDIETLTRQQFAALRGVFELPRVAVTGPAGSGKTLLAIWRLQAVLESGRRALFVCYNTKLAQALQKRHPVEAGSIVSIDKLFSDMCPKSRFEIDKSVYFRETLPCEALDIAASYSENEKFDAIIVDEGQDFSEFQLYALHELLRSDEGEWVIFSDKRQNLFQMYMGETFGAEVVFNLYHNCRNTQQVNRATNGYIGALPVDPMPGMPAGEQPLVLHCPSRESMVNKAWELSKQWSGSGGVVILSPFTLEKSSMALSIKGHGLDLTLELSELGAPGKVYFSTIRSFKGIEAAAIILIDADKPVQGEGSRFRKEDLYVACTRPTARMAILSKNITSVDWFLGRSV